MNDTDKERTWAVRLEARDEETAAHERLLLAKERYHAAQQDYYDTIAWHRIATRLNVEAYQD